MTNVAIFEEIYALFFDKIKMFCIFASDLENKPNMEVWVSG